MRTAIQPASMAAPRWNYSHAIVAGDFVFTSGQVAWDENHEYVADDIRGQAHQVFKNLAACLEEAGSSLDDVVQVMGYLAKAEYYNVYDEVAKEYFKQPYPARMTVWEDFGDRTLIELHVIAYKGDRSE